MSRERYLLLKRLADLLICAAFLSALASAPAAARAEAPADQHAPASTIVAVIPIDAPPTYFRDTRTGKPSGFAVEVMDRVAAGAGLQVHYLFRDNWADMITMVERGEADVIPGMGVSEERRETLDFTGPIDAFPVSFFVRSQSPGLDRLPGKPLVGVIRGSVAYEHLKDRPGLRLYMYEGFGQGLFDLLAGKIDAFACPVPTLQQLAQKSGVEDRIRVVDKPITEIRRAIAVRHGNPVLLNRLDHALRQLAGTREYQTIYTRWYGKPTPYWTPARIVSAGGILLLVVVACMSGWHYVSTVRLNRRLQATIEERRQAEVALSAQAQVLRSFLNAITESAFLVDRRGVVLAANDTFVDRLGKKGFDIVGSRLEEVLPPQVARIRMDHVRAVLGTGKPVRFEDERFNRHILNSVYPVFGGSGDVISTAVVGIDITERKLNEQERERLIAELQKTLAAIKTLHGIIPICSSCKKIRDDEGSWKQLEEYISEHTEAEFSHGVCAECAKKLYPGFIPKQSGTKRN